MLVTQSEVLKSALRWRKGAWLCFGALALCVLSLFPYLTSSTELVRLRNALVLIEERGHGFEWTPATVPLDFMLERGPADPLFVDAAQKLGLAEMSSDWERALAISRHLLSNPKLVGTPIQSNLRDTYRRILEDGTGYCGDFTRVFMAFALAAGIPVRAWAFSFDGFGGYGHIWPEIWNRQLNRWQLVDVFNNFYFHGEDGVAISALEFRQAMLTAPNSIRRSLLHTGARPGYEIEEKMWAWYRKGLPEWYMAWGNNVFSYDRALMVRNLGRFSRSLEQAQAIYLDVHPKVSLLVNNENRTRSDALWRVRLHLMIAAWGAFILTVALVVCLVFWRVALGRNRVVESRHAVGGENAS